MSNNIKIEEKSTEQLQDLESARKKRNYNKAKNMLYEIIDGKTYFTYDGQRYYLKENTRFEGDQLLAFRNRMFFYYCSLGFMTRSDLDQLIKSNPESFPPIVYKVTIRKSDDGDYEDIRNLTAEELDVVKECLSQGIANRETIEDEIRIRLEWSPRTELVMQPGETALTLMNDTAEQRADVAFVEWALMSRIYYADGNLENQRVYKTWEDYYNDEKALKFSAFMSQLEQKMNNPTTIKKK